MSKRGRAFAWVAVAGIVSVPVGWVVTDHLEQDNDFCNDCHLTPEVPLHIDIRRDFDADRPVSLSGVHGLAPVAGRDDAAFRCIDCHGGSGFVGRARVKALAGKDAFFYVLGHFEEPSGMRWPLWDRDCRKCHASFDERESQAWEAPLFHQLPVHNVELGVDCVECHPVHEAGGNPANYFLQTHWVRSQCARCHSEFESES